MRRHESETVEYKGKTYEVDAMLVFEIIAERGWQVDERKVRNRVDE